MSYKILGYDLTRYDGINPYVYTPEPIISEIPITAINASNYIGKQIIAGHKFMMGDPYYLNLKGKEDTSQECIMVQGASGTGKTLLVRLLMEVLWFNGFTPIFYIGRKNDLEGWGNPNVRDLPRMMKYHSRWLESFVGKELTDRSPEERQDEFIQAHSKFRFKFGKTILHPPYMESESPFKLNSRFLDPWQIEDLFAFSTESRYMHIYDEVFTEIWGQQTRIQKDFDYFIQSLEQKVENLTKTQNRQRNDLLSICETLRRNKRLFQEDTANSLATAYMQPCIINLTFYGSPPSTKNSAIVSNFLKQVIECMMHIGSCAVIIDDVAWFKPRDSYPFQRTLDEIVNIEGRTSEAGIKRIFTFQTESQIPRVLRDKQLYNKIFYAKPRGGFIRRGSERAFEAEIVDNDLNIESRLYLRPPVNAER